MEGTFQGALKHACIAATPLLVKAVFIVYSLLYSVVETFVLTSYLAEAAVVLFPLLGGSPAWFPASLNLSVFALRITIPLS